MICGNCKGNHSSANEVKACYGLIPRDDVPADRTLTEELAELERTNPEVAKAAADYERTVRDLVSPRVAIHDVPADGYYTVAFPESDEHRTLRFKTGKNNWEGRVIVSYLAGPDNESDYVGFGHIVGPESLSPSFKPWKRVSPDNMVMRALAIIVDDPEVAANAGEAYALRSSRCCRCNRTLTVPASIHRGMGPECARRA